MAQASSATVIVDGVKFSENNADELIRKMDSLEIPDDWTGDKEPIVANKSVVKLPNQWSLWYCKLELKKQWEKCLKLIGTFDTGEEFSKLYTGNKLASELPNGGSYYLFKDGIRPMWEDPRNVDGGCWLIPVVQDQQNELLDHYWLELTMNVLPGLFDDCNEYVCGVTVSMRQRGPRLTVWTKDAKNDDVNSRIGLITKEKLGISPETTIIYEPHMHSVFKQCSKEQHLRV